MDKNGIILNFKEEPGSLASILTAYVKENPGKAGSIEGQRQILNDVINICGIDEKVWRVKFFKLTPNAWGVTMKQKKFNASSTSIGESGNGTPMKEYEAESESWAEQATNYQLKLEVTFERIAPNNHSEFKETLLSDIRKMSRKLKLHPTPFYDGEYILLVDIPDHHLGRLSWAPESGENYDIKIATKRFMDAIKYFYAEVEYFIKRYPIKYILFVLGNDYFNYDYSKPYPHTSNMTFQESDVRYQKMFSIGSGLVTSQIELLSELAPVKVFVVPGNHDEYTSYFLGEVLSARFHSNERITVENSPKKRKYHQFGANMLGFGHHQFETFERLFANMALEEMKMWGDTTHKYFFTGHQHHKVVKARVNDARQEVTFTDVNLPAKPKLITEDLNGVLFDRMGSLTSNDYYETTRGFIHMKGAEFPIFHQEFGKRFSLNYQLPLSIHKK